MMPRKYKEGSEMEKAKEEKNLDQQELKEVSGGEAADPALREIGIRSYVDDYKTREVSKAQIEKGIINEFGLTGDEARKKVEKYW